MFATPYPKTELFDFAIRTGRIKKEGIHDYVMRLGDAREFVVNLTDAFSDEELQKKYKEMMDVTRKAYRPLSRNEMEKKIKALYGPLAKFYFNLTPQDKEHQAKHGAGSLF